MKISGTLTLSPLLSPLITPPFLSPPPLISHLLSFSLLSLLSPLPSLSSPPLFILLPSLPSPLLSLLSLLSPLPSLSSALLSSPFQCLRIARLEVLCAANTCEDLLVTWRLKVAGKSQAFRLPLPRYVMFVCEGECVCACVRGSVCVCVCVSECVCVCV